MTSSFGTRAMSSSVSPSFVFIAFLAIVKNQGGETLPLFMSSVLRLF